MLFPYSTDAPIYHLPLATLGLIVANVLAYVGALGLPHEVREALLLQYGTINPLQWITSNFIHAGVIHLLGNMICLWVFGLIVEGKLGWWRFLAVYFGIGVAECALEQLFMLGGQGDSCGASSIIFGLMLMALVWAPLNQVSCLLMLTFKPRLIELSISWFAVFYLANETLSLWLSSFHLSSALLHLLGAAAGAVLGVLLLRSRQVDCENWDVFSVLAGRHTRTREELAEEKAASPESRQRAETRRAQLYAEVEHALSQGNVMLAWRAQQTLAAKIPGWKLPARSYERLMEGALKLQLWSESIAMMVEYLKTYPAETTLVRLQLAQVLLEHEHRPIQALKVLAKIPAGALTGQQAARQARLQQQAEVLRAAEDHMELGAEDW